MEIYLERFKRKLWRNIAIAAFLILYFIAFWFMFFTKGIYFEDGAFYKKSANINTVSYTSTGKKAVFSSIELKKYVNGNATIYLAEKATGKKYIVNTDENNPVVHTEEFTKTISDGTYKALANQSLETYRGHGNKKWLFVLFIYVLFFLSKQYSTKIYSFLYKNRAPQESYYRTVDTVFNIFCFAALIYLIIP